MTDALSDRILAENAAVFEAMTSHRFVQDIAADRLPREVFDRYLQIEGGFVETAISIFALAVAKAPDMAARRKLIAVLDALANEQIAYFERVFAARGIVRDEALLAHPDVAAFGGGMLEIAETGSYPEILAAMFAAEWMYLTWNDAVAAHMPADPDLAHWIGMHVSDGFRDGAHWLKDSLDALGAELPEEAKARCSAIFGRAQQLEIDFHSAAYP
ncbi:TenA family protein [Mangrovicoccus ximenensis]|uniref:TenA family protein n=1 Tax=Mangrovicoccus ximenensis TaxID=1911570 RepID=UPI000D3A0F78|nr:TenA family protein [Mangrovicoccus ximenensis]